MKKEKSSVNPHYIVCIVNLIVMGSGCKEVMRFIVKGTETESLHLHCACS